MAAVFYFPLLGTPTALGNKLSFYESGTDVPLDVWTDSDLLIAWAQPIIFNATGNPDGLIYVSPTPDMKVVYTDEDDVAIPGYPVDFVTPSTITNVTTSAIVTLTNAQIKALPTTPITVVAAPDAGLRVRPLACSMQTAFTAGAYTNVNTTSATLQLQTPAGNFLSAAIVNDSSTATDITALTTFFNAAQNRLVDLPVPYNGTFSTAGATGTFQWPDVVIDTDPSDTDAAALQIAVDNNGSGDLTGGNAANTMTVTVYYAVEVV